MATKSRTGCIAKAIITPSQPEYDGGDNTGVLTIGIVASVLLALGLLPPYLEIWKRKGRVIGINFVRAYLFSMVERALTPTDLPHCRLVRSFLLLDGTR